MMFRFGPMNVGACFDFGFKCSTREKALTSGIRITAQPFSHSY